MTIGLVYLMIQLMIPVMFFFVCRHLQKFPSMMMVCSAIFDYIRLCELFVACLTSWRWSMWTDMHVCKMGAKSRNRFIDVSNVRRLSHAPPSDGGPGTYIWFDTLATVVRLRVFEPSVKHHMVFLWTPMIRVEFSLIHNSFATYSITRLP